MEGNTFLKIVAGELPSHKVYEDERVYAFLDIEPYSKGHTLIVPKKYCPDINELDDQTAAAILMAAKKVVGALSKLYLYEGVILHQVNGKDAQEVRHFHMHVYGSLPKDAPLFYKTLPTNQTERETLFSNIAHEISDSISAWL
jgi:histidine triad (HIT) family protein